MTAAHSASAQHAHNDSSPAHPGDPCLVMTVTLGSRQILDIITRSGVYDDLVMTGARMLEPVGGP